MALSRVLVAKPRGFCAGVVRAIEIVDRALDIFPGPIYVFHEIVHNQHVVTGFARRNVVFVDSLLDVPEGAVCVFSAHGVSPEVRNIAETRRLQVIDATCPLVTKVHLEAIKFNREGKSLVLIGHEGHEEVEGTMGVAPMHLVASREDVDKLEVEHPEGVVYLTQTTLSLDDTVQVVEALKQRFPALQAPSKDDICYATQNRQNAVKELAQHVDVTLVVGSQNSSNSQRLCEVSRGAGVPAYLVNDDSEIDPAWLNGAETVGVTAGASAPESLVEKVVKRLIEMGATQVAEMPGAEEDVHFHLPPELIRAAESKA